MNTYYSTKTPGIKGKIKQRYYDFIVEEIQENGNICKVKRFLQEENNLTRKGKSREKSKGKERIEEQLIIPERIGKYKKMQYLHLDLEKKNLDLHQAIRILSRYLGVSRKRIGYAGIKDKNAITCQRISIWMPDTKKLQAFRGKQLCLRNAKWSNEKIDLGKLKANRFIVRIRNISLSEKEIRKRVNDCFKEMKEKGIANYFGEQRFGGLRQVTHLVGKELVKGNIKNAVMIYLTAVGEKEKEEVRNARNELARTMDFSEAIKHFPKRQRYERSMLHHLCRYPNDFVGAFRKLPKKIRFLFTHAYQSYIFNKIIDKRIERGLLSLQKGEPENNGIPLGLLAGYMSEYSKGIIGEIEKEIMREEGVKFSDFKIKTLGECSSKGSRKEILLFPEKMKLKKIEKDELFPGKLACVVSFQLSKGNYATTVLRELMKTNEE